MGIAHSNQTVWIVWRTHPRQDGPQLVAVFASKFRAVSAIEQKRADTGDTFDWYTTGPHIVNPSEFDNPPM